MKPKFEIGDRVIEKEPCFGGYGYVMSVNHYNNPDCYVVKFANGEERVSYIEDFCVEDSEIKTAFLTRLQELLATFDASIEAAGEGTDSATIDIYFNDKQLIYSEDWNDNEFVCKITAENIINYGN